MSEQPTHQPDEDEVEKAGSSDQEYGNLSIEDDAEGTVDPADLAGTGGPEDDGGPVTSDHPER